MNTLQKKLNGKKPIGVYFQSWSSTWCSDVNTFDLAKIDLPINIVFLSFANPSCTYKKGSMSLSGTGLDFSSDFSIVRSGIAKLQSKGIVVMLSVGGATYPFDVFNAESVASLCDDLGCDGVDIDWEDPAGFAGASKLGPIINKMRKALPTKLISLAGFSVGAYGQGKFMNSLPGSSNTGMNVDGLKSNGFQLDFICIMSYDAGPTYNALEAFDAFSSIYSGPLLIGEEIPPEAWGGHVITLDEVKTHCDFLNKKGNNHGIFVWSHQKPGTPNCMDIIRTANNIFKNNNITPIPDPVKPTPIPEPVKPTPIPEPVKPTPIPEPIKPTPIPEPIKPTNANEWVNNKFYKKNDVVNFNGKKYKCEINNVSTELLKPSIKIWSEIDSNLEWRINYNYKVGDIVSFNGKNYKCINAHSSIITWNPEVAITLWK
jgi:hypothetical protein